MNILAAGVLTLFLRFNSKVTALGCWASIGGGKAEGSVSGDLPDAGGQVGGDVSGGISGNIQLPENILTECGVGSADASADADASTSGVEGSTEVNVDVNLPSCDCVRKFDVEGSAEAEDSASGGGVEGSAGDSVSGSASLAMPGVNCVEKDTPDEETDSGYSYTVDMIRDALFCGKNDFITAWQVANVDSPTKYLQTMNADNSLKIIEINITVGKTTVYEVKKGDKMATVCDDSYPEKSVEANIYEILKLSIMDGKGCPVEKGDDYTIPHSMKSVTLSFDKPIPCGNYTLNIIIDTPKGDWALEIYYEWTIEKGATECADEAEQLD
ncbi:uncharacterized protein LOC130675106 [Microplitis mediator]|uniref:uncharacterized protein LOC130675106 n=1 Tax=Microplitis mediator TaxID=375433 RepID=UPI002554C078|nr:uncharacterized protein LOC130675106 [Microplitis mediator]XP_057336584.1 uncharacterized protein LOC130675106 [Microplitis mediator]XP_057336585.1 uncharacterized protein LOC130675106 [Microplitis mediator]